MKTGRPIDKENDTPEKAAHRKNYAARMKKKRATMPTVSHLPPCKTKDYQIRLAEATAKFLALNVPLGYERDRERRKA